MRSSSAKQAQLPFEHQGTLGDRRGSDVPSLFGDDSAGIPPPPSTATLTPPNFSYAAGFAASARIAGRINAAAISDDEHNRLLVERQKLLEKKLSGTLSPKEANHLEYVRWTLDRVEDARQGYVLDMLESAVTRYERFEAELDDFRRQLERLTKRAK